MKSDKVEWIDMGLEQFLKNVTHLDKTRVQVGVLGEAAARPSADGRLKMGEVAHIVNYGAKRAHIPPRDFIHNAKESPVAAQEGVRVVEIGRAHV